MKISVKRSGGFANITIKGEIDTKELPVDLAKKVEKTIKPSVLEKKDKDAPVMNDAQQISIGFESAKHGEYKEYEIDEATADPEVFDVVNELVNQMVKKKLKD